MGGLERVRPFFRFHLDSVTIMIYKVDCLRASDSTKILSRLRTPMRAEDLLEDYFIECSPFFKAVYGDIHVPKSVIVYAPRGGGKTALKRRIELFSHSDAKVFV